MSRKPTKVDDTVIQPVLTPAAKAIGLGLIAVSNACTFFERAAILLRDMPEVIPVIEVWKQAIAVESGLQDRLEADARKSSSGVVR